MRPRRPASRGDAADRLQLRLGRAAPQQPVAWRRGLAIGQDEPDGTPLPRHQCLGVGGQNGVDRPQHRDDVGLEPVTGQPLGALVAIILAAELVFAVGAWSAGGIDLANRAAPIASDISNIQQIGELLYTRYIFLFEAAGIVLLVAMIGAIVLTHRQRGGVRGQNISAQNRRRPQDATRLVDPGVGQGMEL